MGANLAWFEAKFILFEDKGGCTQRSVHVHACDATDLAQGTDKGVNSGVVGSAISALLRWVERWTFPDKKKWALF